MAELVAEFEGYESDQPVRLLLYETHLELIVRGEHGPAAIRVPLEEVGTIEIGKVLGIPVLSIEDTSGTPVASVRMPQPEVTRAVSAIRRIREI